MSDGVYLWFLLQNEITITAQQYVNLIQVAIAQGFHLFPFRTEKLSLVTPMVLRHSGRVGSRRFDWSLRTWRSSGGFFLYPHVWNVTSTVFSPWVWVRFLRNCLGGSAMSFLRQGQVRKFCSVGDDVHKVSLFMSIQIASISKVIYIFADTLL